MVSAFTLSKSSKAKPLPGDASYPQMSLHQSNALLKKNNQIEEELIRGGSNLDQRLPEQARWKDTAFALTTAQLGEASQIRNQRFDTPDNQDIDVTLHREGQTSIDGDITINALRLGVERKTPTEVWDVQREHSPLPPQPEWYLVRPESGTERLEAAYLIRHKGKKRPFMDRHHAKAMFAGSDIYLSEEHGLVHIQRKTVAKRPAAFSQGVDGGYPSVGTDERAQQSREELDGQFAKQSEQSGSYAATVSSQSPEQLKADSRSSTADEHAGDLIELDGANITGTREPLRSRPLSVAPAARPQTPHVSVRWRPEANLVKPKRAPTRGSFGAAKRFSWESVEENDWQPATARVSRFPDASIHSDGGSAFAGPENNAGAGSSSNGKAKARVLDPEDASPTIPVSRNNMFTLVDDYLLPSQPNERATWEAAVPLLRPRIKSPTPPATQDQQTAKGSSPTHQLYPARSLPRPCQICTTLHPPSAYPPNPPTSTCLHPPETCTPCLQTWLQVQTTTNPSSAGIKCPQCSKAPTYTEVKTAATKQVFETWDSQLLRQMLSQWEGFAWCLAPGCGSGQVNIPGAASGGQGAFVQCISCGHRQCLACNTAWHDGETCAGRRLRGGEQRRKLEEERRIRAVIDGFSKVCPGRGCGWRIQKVGGCDQ